MKKLTWHLTLLFFLFSINIFFASAQNRATRPFPYKGKYASWAVLPDIDTGIMAKEVRSFYNDWKRQYLKDKNDEQKYIDAEDRGIISEGQGYGMVIVAMMAGADPDARSIYDKLYNYYVAHRVTKRGSYLMKWHGNNNSSATDGDLDIAYSLLLADVQWGSETNKYKIAANSLISDIRRWEVDTLDWTLLSSNRVEIDSKQKGFCEYHSTRSSDFMPSHLRAFFNATQDSAWLRITVGTYKLFDQLQHLNTTGLIPDFIVRIGKNPAPAPANYQGIEEAHCDAYDYNACRVPWRLGVDWLLDTNANAKSELAIINYWVKRRSAGDPMKIKDGYKLNGENENNKFDNLHLSYVAPFGVAAMIDENNREWLTDIWKYLTSVTIDNYITSKTKGYYDNTIKLYDMIIMSGNFWEYSDH